MFDLAAGPSVILLVSVIFFVAGFAKGTVGGGLPVISIGLLTLFVTLPEAIAIAMAPATVTNIWQAASGGYFFNLLRRLWPYLIASILAVALGTMLLIALNTTMLTILLGGLIVTYSTLALAGIEFKISPQHEKFSGPAFGFVTGLIGGMTGSPAYPGLYFLNGLGFSQNQLVQAMGLCFSVITLSVMVSMNNSDLLSSAQLNLSLLAVIPAMVGMAMGRRLRNRLSESGFKKLFYSSLLVLGLYLVVRSILRLI